MSAMGTLVRLVSRPHNTNSYGRYGYRFKGQQQYSAVGSVRVYQKRITLAAAHSYICSSKQEHVERVFKTTKRREVVGRMKCREIINHGQMRRQLSDTIECREVIPYDQIRSLWSDTITCREMIQHDQTCRHLICWPNQQVIIAHHYNWYAQHQSCQCPPRGVAEGFGSGRDLRRTRSLTQDRCSRICW